MHSGGLHFQLLPFCECVFVPDKSPVEVQHEILNVFLRKLYVVYMEWWVGLSSCDERDVD
jgi:hypothetical protein